MSRSSSTPSTRLGIVSTYPPSRCGIARFTQSLSHALDDLGLHRVEVVRVRSGADRSTPLSSSPRVVMEFDPDDPVSRSQAARRLSACDVAVLQHEFGIYGEDDGVSVLDLADGLVAPLVTVLHTVLRRPTHRQRAIIEGLAERSAALVVPSGAARSLLLDRYRVEASRVSVVPHGSRWHPLPPAPGPRTRLLTWGLLGPGKGIERALHALSRLRDLRPTPSYRIVGQTHPNVLRREGTAYRASLEVLAGRLGVEDMVEFDDHYQDETELWRCVAEAHVVVLPYDNQEQICSGVLTEAISAGRPVVATAFPHAIELLRTGAGLLVDHADPRHMAEAIRSLLVDDAAYARATEEAARVGSLLGWQEVARAYASVFSRVSAPAPAVA